MKNFMEIINGIPYMGRLLLAIGFLVIIGTVLYNFIGFFISENAAKHVRIIKKMCFIMTLVVLAELLMAYTTIFHSNVEISGINKFQKYSDSVSDYSETKNNKETIDSVTSINENQVVTFNDGEVFIIEGSDRLSVGDIVSGEISLQEINKTTNDIWYQYLLVPNDNVEEAIAVGSYKDIIVTSSCSDLGWNITSKGKGGS